MIRLSYDTLIKSNTNGGILIKKQIAVIILLLLVASQSFMVVGDRPTDTIPPVISGNSYLLTSEEVDNMSQEEIKEHIENK